MSNLKDLISIDLAGNLYINGYWVYINKDDELGFMKIDNLTFDKPKNIINVKNQNFKAKMIDDEIKNVLNSGDGNNFIDEDDENNVNFYLNNPETKYINYIDYDQDENTIDSYYMLNGDYKLAQNNYNLDNANYEVYSIDNNIVTFYTQIINDNPFYRITISSDYSIKLNIIGTKIKTFKLIIENCIPRIELINTEFVFSSS